MGSILLSTYDPSSVQVGFVTASGKTLLINSGIPDGDFVTVTRNQEYFINDVGSTGEVARSVVRDATGIITVRLYHTSPLIKDIANMRYTDSILKVAGVGAPPVLAFFVLDPSSPDKVSATQCYLQKDADHVWSNQTSVREYQFYAVSLTTAPNLALSVFQNIANVTNLAGLL